MHYNCSIPVPFLLARRLFEAKWYYVSVIEPDLCQIRYSGSIVKLLWVGMMILWSIFLIVKLGAELMPHPVDESIRDRKPIHSGVESSLNNLSKDESFKNTNDYYN